MFVKTLRQIFRSQIMRKDPDLFKRYNEIIKDHIEARIIERAPVSHIVGETHYLPHKQFLRDEKATARLRIEFDASVKTNGPIPRTFFNCNFVWSIVEKHLLGI